MKIFHELILVFFTLLYVIVHLCKLYCLHLIILGKKPSNIQIRLIFLYKYEAKMLYHKSSTVVDAFSLITGTTFVFNFKSETF